MRCASMVFSRTRSPVSPAESTASQAPSVARFISTLREHAGFFDRRAPITIARAPGRLDLMGGIADYSGALVLELPLEAACFCATQSTADRCVTVRSLARDANEVTVSLDALAPAGAPIDYAAAGALLSMEPDRRWAAYVVGALVVLARERHVELTHGVRILIDSDVPLGKGVSSSAALEVAAMKALCAEYEVELEGRVLAMLCQMVENRVVGAPCGVMDQMTAALGERDRLLALLCQPAEVEGQVALPPDLEVWGIDSGIRHEVGGADYGAVRVGSAMGYRIIADVAGLTVRQIADGRVEIDDHAWCGYLANVTPSEWAAAYRDVVPEVMAGDSFLRRYSGVADPMSHVDASRSYAVRQPTAHPIYEHHRVRRFRALLETGAATEEQRLLLGELMYQSHASYSACGLGSSGTDSLVALARAAGPAAGLYGAKITGGGSGGVVAVLARAGSRATVEGIADDYFRLTGTRAMVLGGSSDGAMRFGLVRVSI